MRVEVNAKLDGIVLDIKTIVATTSSQHTDIRVLEERQRKLEDEQARTDERVRKLDEEMTLQRTKSHDLAGKIQVVRALVERRSSEDQEVNGQREAG
jgi:predicted nuclease with TOPRIM domain